MGTPRLSANQAATELLAATIDWHHNLPTRLATASVVNRPHRRTTITPNCAMPSSVPRLTLHVKLTTFSADSWARLLARFSST